MSFEAVGLYKVYWRVREIVWSRPIGQVFWSRCIGAKVVQFIGEGN